MRRSKSSLIGSRSVLARVGLTLGFVAAVVALLLAGRSVQAMPVADAPAAEQELGLDAPSLLGSVTAGISPANRVVYLNQTFSLDVYVAAGSNQVQSADFRLAFNQSLMHVTGLTVGGALPAVVKRDYNNGVGSIDYAAYIVGGSATGTFRAFTIHFQARNLTSGTLITSRPGTLIVGPAGAEHTLTWTNGRVVILTPPTPTNTLTPSITPTVTPTYTPVPGEVCVSVYHELHDNLVREPDEPLLADGVVEIKNLMGTPVATYVTDGVSEPHCISVRPDQFYVVSVTSPPGYTGYGPQMAYVYVMSGISINVDFGQVVAATPTPTLSPTPSNTPTYTPTTGPSPTPTNTLTPSPTPESTAAVIEPGTGGKIISPDGKIQLLIGPNTVTETMTVTFDYANVAYGPIYHGPDVIAGCMIGIRRAFTFTATYASGRPVLDFVKPLTLTVCYDPGDVPAGRTPALYHWDDARMAWVEVPADHDEVARCLQAQVDYLGYFTLGLDGHCLWTPLIMKELIMPRSAPSARFSVPSSSRPY